MAIFNPDPQPVAEQNYLGWSKEITQPAANTSTETLLKGAGDFIEEGAKGADTVLKEYAQNTAFDQGKAVQNEWVSDIKKANPTDVLTTDASVPQDVESGLRSVDGLVAARMNGKASPTLYYGRLDALAQDLRSRFPGYIDYIDKGLEKATGISPSANTYARSLLSDLNASAQNLKSEKTKTENLIQWAGKEGFDGIPQIAAGFRNGNVSTSQVEQAIYGQATIKNQHLMRMNALAEYKADRELQGDVAKDSISRYSFSSATESLKNTFMTTTIAQGPPDPQGRYPTAPPERLLDVVQQAATGKRTLTDDQWAQAAQILDASERASRLKVTADLRQIAPGTNRSPIDMAGDSHRGLIDEGYAGYAMVRKAITEKDTGLMYSAKTYVEARAHEAAASIVKDPSLGAQMSLIYGFNKLGGPDFALKMNTALVQLELAKNHEAAVKTLYSNMATPLKLNGVDGIVQSFDEAKKIGVPPKALEFITSFPSKVLTDKTVTDEAKVNVIDNAYGEKNNTLLDRIDMDTPTTKGRYGVFQDNTRVEVAREVKRVDDLHGGGAYDKYTKWVEDSFNKPLFGQSLAEIKNFQLGPDKKLTWNTENSAFTVTDKYGNDLLLSRRQGMFGIDPFVKRQITYINEGIQGLKNVYQAGGKGNVDARVLSTLQTMGLFDPSKANVSIPYSMWQAVRSSAKPKTETP